MHMAPTLHRMLEEGAKGVLVCDKNGLPVLGELPAPARVPCLCASSVACVAATGCFSSKDAGFVRSLLPADLDSADPEPVCVDGVEHQVVLSRFEETLVMAIALPYTS